MAVEGGQRGWVVRSRRHSAASLRSVTEAAGLRQKSVMHQCFSQA
jgi:hypothetical protein